MKDCTSCDYFDGYYYDDGTPNDTEYAAFVTDECEIIDEDDTIKTFRQFSAEVKKYEF